MAHARLNLSRMFDWIEACLDAGDATPDDAAIVDRFGFDSPESARTLLAELADAGRISIKGYGATRVITLGRTKSTIAAAPRATPAIKKADPAVDACVARIAEIVSRPRPAGAVHAIQAASALKAVAAKPAPKPQPAKAAASKPTPAPRQKEAVPMPAKSIQLPASAATAIAAIEAYARKHAAPAAPSVGIDPATLPPIATALLEHDFSIDALFAKMLGAQAVPDLSAELAAANARADAAEARLAKLREALEA